MNQGPRWDCLMEKPRGRKSRDSVSLVLYQKALKINFLFIVRLHKNILQVFINYMLTASQMKRRTCFGKNQKVLHIIKNRLRHEIFFGVYILFNSSNNRSGKPQ
jgi:hypothetical protein